MNWHYWKNVTGYYRLKYHLRVLRNKIGYALIKLEIPKLKDGEIWGVDLADAIYDSKYDLGDPEVELKYDKPHNQTIKIRNQLRTVCIHLYHNQIVMSAWATVPGVSDEDGLCKNVSPKNAGCTVMLPSSPKEIRKLWEAQKK